MRRTAHFTRKVTHFVRKEARFVGKVEHFGRQHQKIKENNKTMGVAQDFLRG